MLLCGQVSYVCGVFLAALTASSSLNLGKILFADCYGVAQSQFIILRAHIIFLLLYIIMFIFHKKKNHITYACMFIFHKTYFIDMYVHISYFVLLMHFTLRVACMFDIPYLMYI